MDDSGLGTSGGGAWRPVEPTGGAVHPVGLDRVVIDGGFWASEQDLNHRTMIDHCLDWAERMGWIANFDLVAADDLPEKRRGREFSDSEIYKLLEALAWELARRPDSALEQRYHAVVARVAAAQDDDGYLNTAFGHRGQAERYTDLAWGHELYCVGHLIQAGIARWRTAGPDRLVHVAIHAADHVCAMFGDLAPGAGIPGHACIEMALAELTRLSGDSKYVNQARVFVQRRGHGALKPAQFGAAYFQDDVEVTQREALSGHAVRALYLASGVVDVATECEDKPLLAAIAQQFSRTLARRTYVTGGMGSRHEDEAFGEDFELPPDRSYCETCAGIASIMLSYRLLLQTGRAEYADVIERTLYNVLAASHAADGHSFFYSNPLQQRVAGTPVATDQASPRAENGMRAPWYDVSCCTTNIARTIASLGAYIATSTADGLQLHQYVTGTVRVELPAVGAVHIRTETGYPADGTVSIEFLEAPVGEMELSFRVPGWAAREPDGVLVNGIRTAVEHGYVRLRRQFRAGEVVRMVLTLRPRWVFPDPRIDAVRGCVAVQRGPVVMCAESVDVGADVGLLAVDPGTEPVDDGWGVTVSGVVRSVADADWPYGSAATFDPQRSWSRMIPLRPYYSWGNRGPSTMRVWLPVQPVGSPDE